MKTVDLSSPSPIPVKWIWKKSGKIFTVIAKCWFEARSKISLKAKTDYMSINPRLSKQNCGHNRVMKNL